MKERRRDPRYDRKLDFSIGGDGEDPIKAQSVNISSRGICCTVDHEIPSLSKLKVSMDLPFSDGTKGRLECDGVIVRSEPDGEGLFSVAIYFLNMDRDNASLIGNYLIDSNK